MGLTGTLHTFPLGELLQWMGSARKTGTLSVRGERHTKRLYFKQGRIISSASNDPTEQLGQFLLSHGKISEEDLRRGLETQARTKVLLGRILLMVGVLQEDDLRRLLQMKAEETIFSLFLWEDAHFDFVEDDLPKQLFVPISLEVHDVLLKGLTMIDELRHTRQELGSSGSILARTAEDLPPGDSDPSLLRPVLENVDGSRTITDICLTLHASEFSVRRCLHALMEKGCVKLIKKIEPQTELLDRERFFSSPDALVSKGKEALEAGHLEKAVELLGKAVAAEPRDLEIKKMYDAAADRFRETAYDDSFRPDKVPVLLRDFSELTAEKLEPEEGFLLSRINGSWDLKSIIDISPLGEVEALLIMKRLIARHIIELR
ncbi:MAG: DUF4388 domain-containing protein [Acidobacteriota bacterium]